ncbi:hypothetical protein [Streptomyces halobius]|uniref:Uncharacterized protein n=1 Tax=Streptomyces halobius TaxID=2879846 RepID=A0ABY4M2E9_9ACTN|nr:hypothetical protein [Streptomyces halobius]UQA91890.1 hypothetical protein K9S39_08500 [Streptomyces halobius]
MAPARPSMATGHPSMPAMAADDWPGGMPAGAGAAAAAPHANIAIPSANIAIPRQSTVHMTIRSRRWTTWGFLALGSLAMDGPPPKPKRHR